MALLALMESLKQGDPNGFKKILSAYLEVVNKASFAKKAGIPERTLFRMLTPQGNPTLDSVARVFSVLSKMG
jgi:DNA-binding phage protein